MPSYYCVLAVSGDSNLATDVTDVAKEQDHCSHQHHDDDDDDVIVARDDRCPGDGTSLDGVQPELDSFCQYRFVE